MKGRGCRWESREKGPWGTSPLGMEEEKVSSREVVGEQGWRKGHLRLVLVARRREAEIAKLGQS